MLAAAGWLTDVFGRRRTTLVGLAGFAAASVGCGSADSMAGLLVGRAVQGAAGGLIAPASLALVSVSFDRARADHAIAIVVGSGALGTVIGPAVGGLLAGTVGWRWVFFVNVPLCIAAAAAIYRKSAGGDRLGRRGTAVPLARLLLLTLGVLAVALCVDRGPVWGWLDVPQCLLYLLAAVCLLAFAARERRAPDPLYGPAVHGHRPLLAMAGSGAMITTSFALMVLLLSTCWQGAGRYSSVHAGLLLLPLTAAYALAAYQARRAAARGRGRRNLAAAAALASGTLAGSVLVSPGHVSLPLLALCGLGVGLGNSLTNLLGQHCAPTGAAGRAAAFILTAKTMLAAVGLATAASLLEAIDGSGGNGHSLQPMALGTAGLLLGAAAVAVLGRSSPKR
ncbi:MFS transporter [Streptomyces solincola]|uniref:MFS transporter n=1 Tax=Streptomyces solincola TaxID=2100817 RepID=UPI002158FB99|nr:MFS transporter [Streptomyces solincola]